MRGSVSVRAAGAVAPAEEAVESEVAEAPAEGATPALEEQVQRLIAQLAAKDQELETQRRRNQQALEAKEQENRSLRSASAGAGAQALQSQAPGHGQPSTAWAQPWQLQSQQQVPHPTNQLNVMGEAPARPGALFDAPEAAEAVRGTMPSHQSLSMPHTAQPLVQHRTLSRQQTTVTTNSLGETEIHHRDGTDEIVTPSGRRFIDE